MILSKTTDILTINLGASKTTNELDCYVISNTNGVTTSSVFHTSGLNAVNLVLASTINNKLSELVFLNVFNSDTITHTVIIKLNTYKVKIFEMLVGDSMTYSNGIFQMYDVKGIKK
jgi:hypothetical protein